VFSPYYRRAWQRDPAVDPADHCALNVCLYGPRTKHWAMTERGRRHVARDARSFTIGPSRIEWTGEALEFDIEERCMPWLTRLRGRVTVRPAGLSRFATALDAAGRHRWGPIAPCARIEVDLPQPGVRWSGNAYIDSNEGDEPIERAFRRWDWLRAPLPDGRCAVLYDVTPRDGPDRLVGARFDADGGVEPFTRPQRQRLPVTAVWRVDRRVTTDPSEPAAHVRRTLEDTPFYARSLLDLPLGGITVDAVHETLDVPRLVAPTTQWMLPFRMPRVR
jgi:carotenoid 1,2-hydratase